MNIDQTKRLKKGSCVKVTGKGNGHESNCVIKLIVKDEAHLTSTPQTDMNGNIFVWVTTNSGVWPSHRLHR